MWQVACSAGAFFLLPFFCFSIEHMETIILSLSCLSRDNRFLHWCMYLYSLYIYILIEVLGTRWEKDRKKMCSNQRSSRRQKKAKRYKKKKTFEQGKILARCMTCSTWSPTVKGKRSLTSGEKTCSWSIDRLLVCRVGGENRAPSITLVLEESQVAKHLVSSKKRLKRWRYVHNRLDPRSTERERNENRLSLWIEEEEFFYPLSQILVDSASLRKPIWQKTRDYCRCRGRDNSRVLSSVL